MTPGLTVAHGFIYAAALLEFGRPAFPIFGWYNANALGALAGGQYPTVFCTLSDR
jgi:hypothetical protein